MVQIIACESIQSKLRDFGVSFYSEQKFYENIKDVSVVTCPRHPQFKDRFRSKNVDMTCHCLMLNKGRCNNCKTFNFALTCIADKTKLSGFSVIPADINLEKKKMNI